MPFLSDGADLATYGLSLDGNRMAIGYVNDHGFNNTLERSGAVYLYSFQIRLSVAEYWKVLWGMAIRG